MFWPLAAGPLLHPLDVGAEFVRLSEGKTVNVTCQHGSAGGSGVFPLFDFRVSVGKSKSTGAAVTSPGDILPRRRLSSDLFGEASAQRHGRLHAAALKVRRLPHPHAEAARTRDVCFCLD